ncbi:hypothetical protein F5878DRAFT_660674 [Lentinula raphanica]|uniref:Uncharacterized protein n=1 Tax=Lentinula raphanica TaxID=153919 RepID=A0AA38P9V6_9AGAR|nr:hypothetical protein F5878DRAFT_660674 [Lentinula raphanica]
MEECLRTFENSPDLLDQFQVASAAFFLVQKVAHDTRDRGEEVYFETLRAKTALHRQQSSAPRQEDIEQHIKAMAYGSSSSPPPESSHESDHRIRSVPECSNLKLE